MPNSLLGNHDTQHVDNNNNLLSIPFSDNEPGLGNISSSLLAESILPNPLVYNLAPMYTLIQLFVHLCRSCILVCNKVYMKWECVIALYGNTFISEQLISEDIVGDDVEHTKETVGG